MRGESCGTYSPSEYKTEQAKAQKRLEKRRKDQWIYAIRWIEDDQWDFTLYNYKLDIFIQPMRRFYSTQSNAMRKLRAVCKQFGIKNITKEED